MLSKSNEKKYDLINCVVRVKLPAGIGTGPEQKTMLRSETN